MKPDSDRWWKDEHTMELWEMLVVVLLAFFLGAVVGFVHGEDVVVSRLIEANK